jgi:hypothetical protein
MKCGREGLMVLLVLVVFAPPLSVGISFGLGTEFEIEDRIPCRSRLSNDPFKSDIEVS